MSEGWIDERVEEMPPRLWVRRGAPPAMLSIHRHDDVEINLVLDGRLHYLFGGQSLTIGEGEIAVFWAAQPHGLADSRTGDMCWLHVPFTQFLSGGLPESQTAALLGAQPLITHAPSSPAASSTWPSSGGARSRGARPVDRGPRERRAGPAPAPEQPTSPATPATRRPTGPTGPTDRR